MSRRLKKKKQRELIKHLPRGWFAANRYQWRNRDRHDIHRVKSWKEARRILTAIQIREAFRKPQGMSLHQECTLLPDPPVVPFLDLSKLPPCPACEAGLPVRKA